MKGFVSPTHYFNDQCNYLLSLTPQQLCLEAQDNSTHMITDLNITDSMLKQYHLTIEQFADQIYKQIIHQRQSKKYLLRHQHNTIYFHFNFPKCVVSNIQFQCKWTTLHQLTQQKENIRVFFDELLQSTVNKFQKIIDEKVEKSLKYLGERVDKLLMNLNNEADQKLLQYANFSNQIKSQLQHQCRKQLEKIKSTLIDSNLRCFDEFKVIKEELQTSIITCDDNIKQVNSNVDSLILVMKEQQEKINELQKKLSFNLKSINTRTSLGKREDSNSDIVSFFQKPHSPQRTKVDKRLNIQTKWKSQEKRDQVESPGNHIFKSQ